MKKFLQLFQNPFKRERVLGVAKGKRRYDLPLTGSSSNAFLRLLICLMSILGMLALSASFALSAMTDRWSEGLDNKISVEIPATDSGGEVIEPGIVKSMTDAAAKMKKDEPRGRSWNMSPKKRTR